ncbi:MAG: carboxypeptidase-like regulatory domain-containing protein [Acidobacteria bacterium]|nr:carboxypeptidase-like regulatory domain-containing protein [Acidobacteriota bacterium]
MASRALSWIVGGLALAASSAHPGEIRGRVLVEGEPATGVTVSVLPFEEGDQRARREARGAAAPEPLAEVVTARNGHFSIALEGSGEVPVRLAFSGDTIPACMLQRLLDPAGDAVGDVRLSAARPLAGRVLDERGGPVVGATVRLWAGRGGSFAGDLAAVEALPRSTTTGPDGSFRFETAAESGNRFRVEAPGLATVERVGMGDGALARPVTLGLGQVVRGTVTLPDRRTPAGGAVVRYEGRGTTRWAEVRADGSFLIEGVPAAGGGEIVADAGERGRGVAPVVPGSTESVRVVLAPTATLSGRVVDSGTGRPVSGARLVARAPGAAFLARSGRDGRYVLRGLPPRTYDLEVDDARFVRWSHDIDVAAGRAETRDVPLVRGAGLTGQVVDDTGAPVEGAAVQMSPGGEGGMRDFVRRMRSRGDAVRTDRNGVFTAERLTPGRGQRLDVRHEDYENRSLGGIDLEPGFTTKGVRVVLRRGLELVGVVVDQEERPLAGVEVELRQSFTFRSRRGNMAVGMPDSFPRREAGPDGRFAFQGLKAGDYTLTASSPGYARATVDPVMVSEDEGAEPLVLVLHPGATISGFLRDRSGSGAPGWYVNASVEGQGRGRFGPGGLRTEEPSGPDGSFLIEGLTEGTAYDLQPMSSAGLGTRRAGVVAPSDDVELTVKGIGQVGGRVIEAESGLPVSDFEVSYRPDAQGGMRFMFRAGPGDRGPDEPRSFHSDDGVFVLEDVPAGRWTVEVTAEGFQPGTASGVTVEEGGRVEGVDVALSKGGTIGGQVVESQSGRPVLDATVRAELSGGGGAGRMPRLMGGGANEATTDAEGVYEISGLAPGTWSVTASHPEWSESTVTVELADAPATADLRLGRGGAIGGVVVAGGRPVGGAEVGLTESGDAGFRGFGGGQSSLTGDDGRFRFERLTPGRYTLSAALRSQSSAPVDAVVTGESAQEVTLTLNEGAAIHGACSGLSEDQLAGISVTANGPDGYFASTRTAADASFELTGVPEGSIRLSATAGDFSSSTRVASANVTIEPGQADAYAEIVFEAGYRVEVRVSRSGQPIPDAFVNAIPDSGGRRGASARTDEMGTCVLEGLRDGSYTFMANVQDGAPVRETVSISGDATVDLEVPPGRIAGLVVEAGTGQPLADVSVRVEEGGSGFRFASVVSADSSGRFAFEDVEPRSYLLTFQKPAYETTTRDVNAADEEEVRVEMRRGEGLGLLARDGMFGTPLRGLMVRVVDASGIAVFTGTVPLDSQGRGEIPSVAPGSYELRVSSSGYAPVVRPGIVVPSSELAFALTPGGTLEIQVGPETQALPQPQALLYRADGRVYLPSIFSMDGVVPLGSPVRRLENVAPGRYVLAVEGGARQEIEVREGTVSVAALP